MESVPENRLLKLPPGAMENIRKIHNLDKKGRLEEAINILEEWIKKQDHIIKKDFSKDYLERTLITCKGSVERSKKQIDKLCTMKTLAPKFFLKTNVKMELPDILEMAWQIPLPIITEDFYRVVILKVNNKNLTSDSLMQYYQFNMNFFEYLKANDYVNGYIGIVDLNELNMLDLLSKFNPMELQQHSTIAHEGFGARVKSIHLLTDSKTVGLLLKTIKHFISAKMGDRVHAQPSLEDLHKVVPKEILPIEYGGNERSIKELREEWVEELSSEKHVEYMKMMRKAGTDVTKQNAVKFNEEYMGMPGSFRCLSVD